MFAVPDVSVSSVLFSVCVLQNLSNLTPFRYTPAFHKRCINMPSSVSKEHLVSTARVLTNMLSV